MREVFRVRVRGEKVAERPLGEAGDCDSTKGGYYCTLDDGHDGLHAAHGADPTQPDAEWGLE